MKYNPKINEEVAQLFNDVHPLLDADMCQGSLRLMYDMEKCLCEICGMDAFTLQPAAGAHGELTGLMHIRAYHEHRGDRPHNHHRSRCSARHQPRKCGYVRLQS